MRHGESAKAKDMNTGTAPLTIKGPISGIVEDEGGRYRDLREICRLEGMVCITFTSAEEEPDSPLWLHARLRSAHERATRCDDI